MLSMSINTKSDIQELKRIHDQYPNIWNAIKYICPCKMGVLLKNDFCWCDDNNMALCWDKVIKENKHDE